LSSDGKRLVVGAAYNDDGGENAGHARVYDLKYYLQYNIISDYEYDDGSITSWCLDLSKVRMHKPLRVRPCKDTKRGQFWFHDKFNQLRLVYMPAMCADGMVKGFV